LTISVTHDHVDAVGVNLGCFKGIPVPTEDGVPVRGVGRDGHAVVKETRVVVALAKSRISALALGVETRTTKSGTRPASHVVDVIVSVSLVPADDATWVKSVCLSTFVPREKRRDGVAHKIVVGRVSSICKLKSVEASVISVYVRLDVN